MAFNNPFYPNYNYFPGYNPGYAAQAQQVQQNTGFVPIPSEEDARNYPIQRGSSVTFRDENQPYIYIKTLGFGQLDSPVFEKYRLTKETAPNVRKAESAPPKERDEDLSNFVTKAEYEAICGEIDELRSAVDMLRRELGS